MNLNPVLAVVPWDIIEPADGNFDFTLVDQRVADARMHDLRCQACNRRMSPLR